MTGLDGRPDFFIIGAQKSGTTSLWECLLQHDRIIFRVKKEIHYWEGRNGDKSLRWYESHFPSTLEKRIWSLRPGRLLSGEATPVMGNGTDAPFQLHEAYPNLQIIAILRNPVKRAYSHYKHLRRHHPEAVSPDFEEAFLTTEDIRRRGVYAKHLREWFSLFGRDQVRVLSFDRFVHEAQAVADRCFEFLRLPSSEIQSRHSNKSSKDSRLRVAVEEKLREFYRPHNEDLYELLGRDFGWPA